MPYKPICFMVMPFGVKDTQATTAGAPLQVNFDSVWNQLWLPLISELGYEPVRADADLGASIIREMIERLALSDLVLADLTLPNANVFYEVGVRHAACKTGCVLVAAEWSRQPFDVQSMRHAKYKLSAQTMTREEATANLEALCAQVEQLATSITPCYELEGFPNLPRERTLAFRNALLEMNAFNARVTALHEAPHSEARERDVQALVAACKAKGQGSLTVSFELLKLLRDTGDDTTKHNWQATLNYIDQLPQPLRGNTLFVEQRALALAKVGEPHDAIGALKALIASDGSTPEREGLLGGRYKALWRSARDVAPRVAAGHLEQAIEHYERGRELDLNQYYAASNLPLLLRWRNRKGDAERAARVAVCVVAACERAIERATADEFVYPTLLGAAFHADDVGRAEELVSKVRFDPNDWKLRTSLADLRDTLTLSDGAVRASLERVLATLESA